MRSMEKGRMMSCQITYFPIDTDRYIEEIKEVLEIIKSYGLECHVDLLSTTIRGEDKKIFEMLQEIHQRMSEKNYSYTMSVMISNICGCGQ